MTIYFAVAVLLSMSALAGAIGVSLLGGKLLEGTARQPELAPLLQSKFFIVVGLVDAIPMIGVGIALYMLFAV